MGDRLAELAREMARPDVWMQHHGRCLCITEQPHVPCACPRGWPRRAAWWRGQAAYGARQVEALLKATREARNGVI